MVKSYLRYEPAAVFGVIVSTESNISYDRTGKQLLAPALENIGVWSVRQGICNTTLSPSTTTRGPSIAVTSIASSPSSLIASGYANGSIRIWDCEKGTCETTLNGHKGAVTALRYNKLGALLASGSKDNDVILWDVVGETGLFRLRGHRGQVTDVAFLDSGKKLVSSSKDKFLRLWDLDTQHCVQIISGHHSEIWSIDVDPEERYLVTGSADPELRFYTIKHEVIDGEPASHSHGTEVGGSGDSTPQDKWQVLSHFGEIQRQSKDRVGNLRFNKSGNLLACQMAGKMVEIFRVLDETESKRKAKRRVHRKKEKKTVPTEALGENGDMETLQKEEGSTPIIVVSDVFKVLQTLRASKKICSISFCPITQKNSLATLALSLNNNLIEIYTVETTSATETLAIELPGHRSDVRSVTLSSDNTLLMSTSHNSVKIWNPSTGSCLRTIDSGYGLCGSFLPGNRFALVGTKTGTLEFIDVGSGTCVEVVEAHGGSVRSIAMLPNENGFVTGGTDRDVKFWEYIQKPGQQSQHQVVQSRKPLSLNEDVLVVVVSPDSKYVAAALLDNTIKVYFLDTLKFFLSLYGHKLPVLCMDVSSDGDLIVSGSADKNLKIWGLDFGDCHKSIFAHSESVEAVQFVHNTHYMFSVGKDRLIKYWDADKFELLLTLDGHHAEIWCLSISNRGDFIVTGSHDRSIRRWDRTEEPFFIEEEKEKRLDEMFETDLDNSFENRYAMKEEIPEEGVVGLAGKKTQETLTATDLIIDALDLADVELKRMAEHKGEKTHRGVSDFQPNVVMLGLSPSDYILRALANVHTNDLEQTLLALPFSDALKLMSYLKDWSSIPDKVELICRVATVLLQIHHNQLVTTTAARPILITLKDILYARVNECKDTLGFNLAAMDHLKQLMSSKSDALFRDAKSKLLEIRSKHSKRLDSRTSTDSSRRRRRRRGQRQSGNSSAYGEVPSDSTLSTSQLPYPNPREMCLPPLDLPGSQLPYPKPLDISISAAHLPNPRKIPWMNLYEDEDSEDSDDTPEYEALCIADRERAESEMVGPRNLHLLCKNRKEMPYSIDKLARPVGWDTCPRPTLENINPLWYTPPLPGIDCSICGSSEHHDGVCSYLYEFPPDGCLLNKNVYEVVCDCGRAIDRGQRACSCFSDMPMRVAAKIGEPFWSFGREHLSLKELKPRCTIVPHFPPRSSQDDMPRPKSFVEFCEKLDKGELIPRPWQKDIFELIRSTEGNEQVLMG